MSKIKRDYDRVMKETVAKMVSATVATAPKTKLPPSRLYFSDAWKRVRKEVLRRDGYRCVFCGKDVSGYKKSRIDHIVPLKEEPSLGLDPKNLRTLCAPCDNRRHVEKGQGMVKPPVNLDGFPREWVDALKPKEEN